jgi:hypothetical protein
MSCGSMASFNKISKNESAKLETQAEKCHQVRATSEYLLVKQQSAS